MTMVMVEK